PSGFLFLTQADTDLLALSKVVRRLDPDVPPVRAHNLSHLAADDDVDAFLATVLPVAEVVVVRLLGGRSSFAHGLDRIAAHARAHDQFLVCLPGTDALDPELTALSNVGLPVVHDVLAYLQLGGLKNVEHMLRFLSDHLLMTGVGYDAPEPQPRHGVYHPDVPDRTLDGWRLRADPALPTIGLLFYRSHLLSGNTDFVDALVRAGEARGANVLPVYAYSLKEPAGDGARVGDHPLPAALSYFLRDGRPAIDVLVATTSFALSGGGTDHAAAAVLRWLDVPIVQAIAASADRKAWEQSQRGLGPLDTAMNVAIPEFDGRIVGPAVSFKQPEGGALLGAPVVRYAPHPDRVERIVGQALRLAALRRRPNREKRIAFILTNYNAKASRVANAVGLDSPASLVRLLGAMREAGYDLPDVPPSGDALLQALIARGSYDQDVVTEEQLATAPARVPPRRYAEWFADLPEGRRREVAERWGAPSGRHYVDGRGHLALAGIELGNAFIAIQPPR
ncbi:MAG TPA: cobaltochelatase subunit CobN, partial [Solirubrobacteraceae bacterium]